MWVGELRKGCPLGFFAQWGGGEGGEIGGAKRIQFLQSVGRVMLYCMWGVNVLKMVW